MKFSALSLLSLVGLIQAKALVTKEAVSCSSSVLSCHWSGTVDACCSPKYGLVVLTLQWDTTIGPSDEFTIHGLWPDACDGTYAPSSGCDSSRTSSTVATIVKGLNQTLYNQMSTYWPSNTGDNNWFWSHEWSKHGTCVSTLRPTCYGSSYTKYQEIGEYFEKVLELRNTYDLYGALNSYGIIPGARYNVETIRSAIRETYGADVKLDCSSKTLSEVGIYFYVQGRDTYEITDTIADGSCSGSVYYPSKD